MSVDVLEKLVYKEVETQVRVQCARKHRFLTACV